MEDSLRKLRDKLAEVEIENNSYQVLQDAEKQLREARNEAEASAANSVNNDLKDHIKRLQRDVEVGQKNREGSKRMIDELRAKYQEVAGLFEKYLREAVQNKEELEGDLNDLRVRISNKNQENVEHKNDIDQNERVVSELSKQVHDLTTEIEKIKQ